MGRYIFILDAIDRFEIVHLFNERVFKLFKKLRYFCASSCYIDARNRFIREPLVIDDECSLNLTGKPLKGNS